MLAMLLAAYSRGEIVVCGLIAVLVVGSFVATSGEGWKENVHEYGMKPSEEFWAKIGIRINVGFMAILLFFYLVGSR